MSAPQDVERDEQGRAAPVKKIVELRRPRRSRHTISRSRTASAAVPFPSSSHKSGNDLNASPLREMSRYLPAFKRAKPIVCEFEQPARIVEWQTPLLEPHWRQQQHSSSVTFTPVFSLRVIFFHSLLFYVSRFARQGSAMNYLRGGRNRDIRRA